MFLIIPQYEPVHLGFVCLVLLAIGYLAIGLSLWRGFWHSQHRDENSSGCMTFILLGIGWPLFFLFADLKKGDGK